MGDRLGRFYAEKRIASPGATGGKAGDLKNHGAGRPKRLPGMGSSHDVALTGGLMHCKSKVPAQYSTTPDLKAKRESFYTRIFTR